MVSRPSADAAKVRSLIFELAGARDRIAELENEVSMLRHERDLKTPVRPFRLHRGPKLILLRMLLGRRSLSPKAALETIYKNKARPKSHVISTFVSFLRKALEPHGCTIQQYGRAGDYYISPEDKDIIRRALVAAKREAAEKTGSYRSRERRQVISIRGCPAMASGQNRTAATPVPDPLCPEQSNSQ